VAAALVGGHVLATRGPSWFLGHLPADFSTVAFTMEGLLAPLFYPYYVIFSSAAAYHALYGTSQGTVPTRPCSVDKMTELLTSCACLSSHGRGYAPQR
jgi:hypothetical protein